MCLVVCVSMGLLTFISVGAIGQSSVSLFGPYGCVGLSCLLFAAIAIFIGTRWTKDVAGSRFMLSSFSMSVGQTLRCVRLCYSCAILLESQ